MLILYIDNETNPDWKNIQYIYHIDCFNTSNIIEMKNIMVLLWFIRDNLSFKGSFLAEWMPHGLLMCYAQRREISPF